MYRSSHLLTYFLIIFIVFFFLIFNLINLFTSSLILSCVRCTKYILHILVFFVTILLFICVGFLYGMFIHYKERKYIYYISFSFKMTFISIYMYIIHYKSYHHRFFTNFVKKLRSFIIIKIYLFGGGIIFSQAHFIKEKYIHFYFKMSFILTYIINIINKYWELNLK